MSDLTLEHLLTEYSARKAHEASGRKTWQSRQPSGYRVLSASRIQAQRKSLGVKHDNPTGTPVPPYLTGPGGVWGVGYSLQQDVLSTRMQAFGLMDDLPWYPSNDMNPIYPYLTGWTSPTYTPPDTGCELPTAAGFPKTCTVNYRFGKYPFATPEFELNDVGSYINRGEARDLRFVNDPMPEWLGEGIFGLTGDSALLNGNEFLARLLAVGVQASNIIGPQVYTGDKANGNGDGYDEFDGLDISIRTGITDYMNPGTACPTLDSIVEDFNFEDIEDPAFDIVGLFSAIMAEIVHRAERMRFRINFENREEFSIEMPYWMFWTLTRIWPCSYLTDRCKEADGVAIAYVGGQEQIDMRDAMRNSNYLYINGKKISVIVDDNIAETAGDGDPVPLGCLSANVYFTTRRVNGGFDTLYWEYFDFSGAVMRTAESGRLQNFWSDNGVWLWTALPSKSYCVQWEGKLRPRLVNLSPFLDAKVTNVAYCPDTRVTHRSGVPSNPNYVNGGVSAGRPVSFPSFAILTCNPPDGTDNVVYVSYTFTAVGGAAPLVWYGNNLPPGLTLNSSTGVLSGTPVTPGTYVVVITVVDANLGTTTCTTSISIAA